MKIVAIKIIDRIKEAGKTQSILSNHASEVLTRLGFHEVSDALCSREAVIILQVNSDAALLVEELQSLGGLVVRVVDFDSNGCDVNNTDCELDSSADIIVVSAEKTAIVVGAVQNILTSYGCNIRTRLGISLGEEKGLIILELMGDDKQRLLLENDLKCVNGVDVRKMVF